MTKANPASSCTTDHVGRVSRRAATAPARAVGPGNVATCELTCELASLSVLYHGPLSTNRLEPGTGVFNLGHRILNGSGFSEELSWLFAPASTEQVAVPVGWMPAPTKRVGVIVIPGMEESRCSILPRWSAPGATQPRCARWSCRTSPRSAYGHGKCPIGGRCGIGWRLCAATWRPAGHQR